MIALDAEPVLVAGQSCDMVALGPGTVDPNGVLRPPAPPAIFAPPQTTESEIAMTSTDEAQP